MQLGVTLGQQEKAFLVIGVELITHCCSNNEESKRTLRRASLKSRVGKLVEEDQKNGTIELQKHKTNPSMEG